MKTYKNLRTPFTGPVVATHVHVTDRIVCDMETIDVVPGSIVIPKLRIQDSRATVELYFETT